MHESNVSRKRLVMTFDQACVRKSAPNRGARALKNIFVLLGSALGSPGAFQVIEMEYSGQKNFPGTQKLRLWLRKLSPENSIVIAARHIDVMPRKHLGSETVFTMNYQRNALE